MYFLFVLQPKPVDAATRRDSLRFLGRAVLVGLLLATALLIWL